MPFPIYNILKKGGFSSEAQAVIDRMTGLTGSEESAISSFVDSLVSNGNWALIDEFFCFGLDTSANALTGWVAKTATNNGATKTANGFVFDGTGYIDSNWNPSDDGVNYSLNSAQMSTYLHSHTSGTGIVGLRTNGGHRLEQFTSVISVNSGITWTHGVPLTTQTLWGAVRNDSANIRLFKDGVENSSSATASLAVPLSPLHVSIGGRNNKGVIDSHITGIISSVMFGGAVGFDHSSYNTNINTLLTSLGAI